MLLRARGKRIAELSRVDLHYRDVLNLLPVSVWEEDFSEVKRYVESLRQQGVRDVREYLKRHPETVVELARMVKIIWFNEATLRLLHARTMNELRQGLNRIFGKESYDVFREEVVALSGGQCAFTAQAVNITLEGDRKDILIEARVAPGHEADLSRVIVTIVDISELKRTEAEIRESEAKYRTAFQEAGVAMLLADAESGIIIDANKAAEKLFDMARDSLAGTHQIELHPAEQVGYYRQLFQEHHDAGGKTSPDCVVQNRSGRKIPVSISTGLLRLKDRTCVLGLFQPAQRGVRESGPRREPQPEISVSSPTLQKDRLSKREAEVVSYILKGQTNKQIGETLGISQKTVETHRARAMGKLGVHSTAELVTRLLSRSAKAQGD